MKIRASSLFVLTAALAVAAVTPGCVAPSSTQAFSHPVGAVERFGHTLVARGFSMANVERSLGAPHRKLSEQVWAYANFNGGSEHPADDDCSTLILTFRHGQVANIELVNHRAEQNYAAQLRAWTDSTIQVAAK